MSISSIHFENVKSTSQSHNLRLREFDYVRQDLTHLNKSFGDKRPHSEIISELKEIVKEKTKRAAQGKAKFILEGVFLIEKKHTNEDLKEVAGQFQKKFKAKIVGLHIHRDEGHYDENKIWKPNLHAHLLIENIDRKTGKSHRWNKEDLSSIQTFFAEALQMDRGKSSEKKHLNSLDYKIKAKEEQLKLLEEKALLREKTLLNSLEQKIKAKEEHLKFLEGKVPNIENLLSREEKLLSKERDLVIGDITLDFAKKTIVDFGKFMQTHPKKPKLDELNEVITAKKAINTQIKNSTSSPSL